MMYDVYQDRQVQLAVYLKIQKMNREEQLALTTANLLGYLKDVKWRFQKPQSLHEAINGILSLNSSDIVDYLATRVIIEAKDQSLTAYRDMFQ